MAGLAFAFSTSRIMVSGFRICQALSTNWEILLDILCRFSSYHRGTWYSQHPSFLLWQKNTGSFKLEVGLFNSVHLVLRPWESWNGDLQTYSACLGALQRPLSSLVVHSNFMLTWSASSRWLRIPELNLPTNAHQQDVAATGPQWKG